MYARRLIETLWTFGGRMSCGAPVILICVFFSSFGLFPVSASAQSASFRSVDTNSDGVLTFDELVAEFGRDGANRLLRSTDHNGDLRITIPELRRGPDDDDRDRDQQSGSSTDQDNDSEEESDDGDDGGDDNGGDDGGDDGSDDD